VSGFTGWTVERWSLAVAALVTVAAAVSMDVIADEHPTHTLTLGLIAVVVAALRIKLDGRYQGLFSTERIIHAAR
jgi:peptidoglycan/LPS O-acetylase OafA/YrhL